MYIIVLFITCIITKKKKNKTRIQNFEQILMLSTFETHVSAKKIRTNIKYYSRLFIITVNRYMISPPPIFRYCLSDISNRNPWADIEFNWYIVRKLYYFYLFICERRLPETLLAFFFKSTGWNIGSKNKKYSDIP